MEEYQEYPSHYPGQPHMPVRRRRVTFRKHFQNQWDNSRGFFKQWWHQKKGSKQQPASYYPPQTGAGVLRPQKRQRKHYQYFTKKHVLARRLAISRTLKYFLL
jgi:hypothetical protein